MTEGAAREVWGGAGFSPRRCFTELTIDLPPAATKYPPLKSVLEIELGYL